jgi:hypothetical protein
LPKVGGVEHGGETGEFWHNPSVRA